MSIPKKEELHRLVDRLAEQNIAKAKRYLEMLVKSAQPESAAIPRPGNRPFYIDPFCPTCGTPLVPADMLDNPNANEGESWYDEFICPTCRNGIFLDWPENEKAALTEGQYREGNVDWDELKRELDL